MTILIVAIHRNESRYMKEWIEWNIHAGIDKIVLYDNNIKNIVEEQKTKDILEYYGDKIDMIKWHHMEDKGLGNSFLSTFLGIKNKQHLAYANALKNYSHYNIIVKIDIDEFVVPIDGKPLKNVWKRLEDYMLYNEKRGIRLYSMFFGSSNIEDTPSNYSVVQTYTHREKIPSNFKDVAIISSVRDAGASAHWWRYKLTDCELSYVSAVLLCTCIFIYYIYSLCIPTHTKIIFSMILLSVVLLMLYWWNYYQDKNCRAKHQNICRINHYFVKSKNEFIVRRKYDCDNKGAIPIEKILDRLEIEDKYRNEVLDEQAKNISQKELFV